MDYSKLKIFFYVAVCLTMLLAPFTLAITPDGNAYAFSSRSRNNPPSQIGQKSGGGTQTSWSEYKPLATEGQEGPRATHPVPEPATMLLVGAGLASLAIFRKKIKK